jgi:hypothetical protein
MNTPIENAWNAFVAVFICAALGTSIGFLVKGCDQDMNVRALQKLPVHMVTNDVTTAIVSGDTVQIVFSNLTTTLATNYYPSTSNPSNYVQQDDGIPADWVDTDSALSIIEPSLNSNQLTLADGSITGAVLADNFLTTNHVPNNVIPRQIAEAECSGLACGGAAPGDVVPSDSSYSTYLLSTTVTADRAGSVLVSIGGMTYTPVASTGNHIIVWGVKRVTDGVTNALSSHTARGYNQGGGSIKYHNLSSIWVDMVSADTTNVYNYYLSDDNGGVVVTGADKIGHLYMQTLFF